MAVIAVQQLHPHILSDVGSCTPTTSAKEAFLFTRSPYSDITLLRLSIFNNSLYASLIYLVIINTKHTAEVSSGFFSCCQLITLSPVFSGM
jgi:hypothetical protein